MIIHSMSGITLKFGNLISEKLQKDGHSVDIVQLKTDVPIAGGTITHHKDFKITNQPDISSYDTILVGCPVWAFTASIVAYQCVTSFPNLKGKKFLPFITMGFFLPGMGGKQAVELMTKTAKDLGADVLPGSIACKMLHNIDQMMEKEANKISEKLKTKN